MTSQLGQEAPVARATARFVRVTPMKARRVVDDRAVFRELHRQAADPDAP